MKASPRTPRISGNWKMNLDGRSANELVCAIRQWMEENRNKSLEVGLFPPAVYLAQVVELSKGSPIHVGAQNAYFEKSGAFTGEISLAMIRDVGATGVLIGHSERRHVFGESEEWITKKLNAALALELEATLCVGEKLEERESGRAASVIERQIRSALSQLQPESLSRVTIAYEPVWAIGTGKTASPKQADEAHQQIRQLLAKLYSPALAEKICIQYGGSVTPENAAALLAEPQVDGFLVGGASLDFAKFRKILEAV